MPRSFVAILIAACCFFMPGSANSSPVLWAHDAAGRLGTIDLADGTVNLIGNMGPVMTDIAYDMDGSLWGLSTTDLYRIDPRSAAATLIGPHSIPQGNALVFGADGLLYAAGAGAARLYTIDTATGQSTNIGTTGFLSAGDLAFYHGGLYLSSTHNELIRIDLDNHAKGTRIGSFGFSSVYGLATADDDTLYGISLTRIFAVDVATGQGTLVLDYKGHSLGASFGSSFITEAIPIPTVPLPPAALLLGSVLPGLVLFGKRWRG
jgi:sugar lactone lactonase YvrE